MQGTKNVYILIAPDKGTFSPAMHNAAFRELELPLHYSILPTTPMALEHSVEALRQHDVVGANVTIPHKEAILPYLDVLSDEARAIGAVNTVVHRDGKLYGYNTDATGFMQGLAVLYPLEMLYDAHVLVLGAGGAARAIVYALNQAQTKHISIYNRTQTKAVQLLNDLAITNASVLNILDGVQDYDIIINTTPIGSQEHSVGTSVLSREMLPHKGVVCDIIYRPATTRLLRLADDKGLKTQNGIPMLLHQGALAFSLWTGVVAPLETMRKTLMASLV